MHVVRSLVVLGLVLVPAVAHADPPAKKPARTARVQKGEGGSAPARTCTKAPVEVVSGAESATFPLAECDGKAFPLGVDQLSVLARPGTAAKPRQAIEALAKARGPELAPGIRRIDPRLVERFATLIEHFSKDGHPTRVVLVSGYRPRSAGSYHQTGRALDFRIEGVSNEALVAFCKTLPDTGCGYYPNGSFAHIDVRDRGVGHVSWIDASRPGEPPKYVSTLPPAADAPAADEAKTAAPSLALPALPAWPAPPPGPAASPARPSGSGSKRHPFWL
jgi:hypothetical protein